MLATLAPLFWMWNSATALLVAQAVLLALAGVPVFLFGRDRLGPWGGLAFQATYLVFWGALAGVLYDFHHVVFAVPAIAAALYACGRFTSSTQCWRLRSCRSPRSTRPRV